MLVWVLCFMILHLGNDCFVKLKEILMILDYKEAMENKDTSHFLKTIGESACPKSEENPKSVVVTEEQKELKVYFSAISSKTLLKRGNENTSGLML